MADETARPLLDRGSGSPSPERPSSPPAESHNRHFELSSESTPLLNRRDDDLQTYGTEAREYSPSESEASYSGESSTKSRRRAGPVFFSIITLVLIAIVIVLSFTIPSVTKEYVKEAAVFQPTSLSVDSATEDGVRTRVQGDFVLDSSRVQKNSVRGLGRLVTWIAREVETGESEVEVYLPEHKNVLVGTASLPSVAVNIRNRHVNHVDVQADLTTGDVQGVKTVAVDWLEGKLHRLLIDGKATVHLKSGLLSLGTQSISHSMVFEGWLPCVIEIDAIGLLIFYRG